MLFSETNNRCLSIVLALFAVIITDATNSQAEVKLPAIFSDGMVIQRESRANIWGWADPGEKIEIRADWGAEADAVADSDGNWKAVLRTPSAGGPFQISVNGIAIKDILSGEVWLCSGQSNMSCNMLFFTKKAKEVEYQPLADRIKAEIGSAQDPLLRQIEVPHKVSPFEELNDFRGNWISCAPGRTEKFTATGYYFGRELRRRLDVPVGLIKSAWGGTMLQPWIPAWAYESDPDFAAYYKKQMDPIREKIEKKRKFNLRGIRQYPSVLFNGMIAPVRPYTIRGAIWYQGESNAKRMPHAYREYFETLITSWRKEWGQADLSFYWAQLAGFNANGFNAWKDICDAQRHALELSNTGMAVLNDIGEAKDIHPRNKMDVGRRLALWALANDYRLDLPAYSGPLFEKSNVSGGKFIVKFTHCGSGLMTACKKLDHPAEETDTELGGFELKGADGKWMDAEARIVSKDTVEVFNSAVEEPLAVRYAWKTYTADANLYNRAGLPASLFTTEQ